MFLIKLRGIKFRRVLTVRKTNYALWPQEGIGTKPPFCLVVKETRFTIGRNDLGRRYTNIIMGCWI